MAVKVRPAKGRFVVKPHDAGEVKTESGIIIPNSVMPEFGKVLRAFNVISIGEPIDGAEFEMPKKGDNLLMAWYAGQELTLNETEYRVCTPDLIWAFIDGFVPRGEDPESHGES